jgi:hypothetical protein
VLLLEEQDAAEEGTVLGLPEGSTSALSAASLGDEISDGSSTFTGRCS